MGAVAVHAGNKTSLPFTENTHAPIRIIHWLNGAFSSE